MTVTKPRAAEAGAKGVSAAPMTSAERMAHYMNQGGCAAFPSYGMTGRQFRRYTKKMRRSGEAEER